MDSYEDIDSRHPLLLDSDSSEALTSHMDATDQTTNQTISPTISQTTRRNRDYLDVLGDGPLAVPVWRLWEGLDALMRAGRLRGVDLDLAHPACPCFLLDVAPGAATTVRGAVPGRGR